MSQYDQSVWSPLGFVTLIPLLVGLFGCASSDEQVAQPAASAEDSQPAPGNAPAPVESDWTVKRVGGDMSLLANQAGDVWTVAGLPCAITTALPAGYPAPTPPGVIEIKRYPTVRRAQVTGGSSPDIGMYLGFWPLFRHIERNEIAMTSPVELNYHGYTIQSQDEGAAAPPDQWTMSFLYRTPDLHPVGSEGVVTIVDAASTTVISLGVMGPYRMESVRAAVSRLTTFLATQPDWEIDGEVRALYYNGPEMPENQKWAEVQIPVRPASAAPRSADR